MIVTGPRVAARLTVVLACHLGVGMGLPDAAAAEERQLFMLVMNRSGEPVLDLRTDEVTVQQTGGECRLVSLHPEIDGMKIALLVDNSETAANSLNPLRAGLRAFSRSYHPNTRSDCSPSPAEHGSALGSPLTVRRSRHRWTSCSPRGVLVPRCSTGSSKRGTVGSMRRTRGLCSFSSFTMARR